MDPSRYRPDIDGLRAIAVLGVVLYHAGSDTFSGGFVGVDVFFVISGFLITRLINDGIQRGSFSFSHFYVRRARRLFPALFFTLSLTLIFASFIFLPQHLERFGGALLHSILSVSNFYFWSESGYFDTGAHLKPLLHTWSLSVEEQFYLFWPSIFYLLVTSTKKNIAPVFIFITGIISFYLSVLWVKNDPTAAFYLAPFRVFEFAIGAIMVWLVDCPPKRKYFLEPIFLIGMALILYPIFTYTPETPFPGKNALIPCIGTALLIYSGTAKYGGRLLNNRLAVGIGLISYSLYLIHWPVIVFYKYYFVRPRLGPLSASAIIVISIIGATLMYFFVEKPFRSATPQPGRFSAPAFGLTCALCSLLLVLPAAHIWAENGWEWRFPADVIQVVGSPKEKRDASWAIVNMDNSVALQDFHKKSSKKYLLSGILIQKIYSMPYILTGSLFHRWRSAACR